MPARQPNELHALFVEAFNRCDAEALADLYEPDAVLMTRAGTAAGREAICEAYRQMLKLGGRMELQTLSILASTDVALLHSAWVIDRDGKTRSGTSNEVARRQSGGTWLFLLDEPRTPGIADS